MSSGLTPSASALKFVIMRCRSTGWATARTSSQDTWNRPRKIARAFAASTKNWLARTGSPGDVVANEIRNRAFFLARQSRKLHRVTDHIIGDWDFANDVLHFQKVGAGDHAIDLGTMGRSGRLNDAKLFVLVRIIDPNIEHEAILLGSELSKNCPFFLDAIWSMLNTPPHTGLTVEETLNRLSAALAAGLRKYMKLEGANLEQHRADFAAYLLMMEGAIRTVLPCSWLGWSCCRPRADPTDPGPGLLVRYIC